jgi:hypothetical protein
MLVPLSPREQAVTDPKDTLSRLEKEQEEARQIFDAAPGRDFDMVSALLTEALQRWREERDELRGQLREAVGAWEWAMPQEMFANNQANREMYDRLSFAAGGKPMHLGRNDAEYEVLCKEFEERRAAISHKENPQ